MSDCGHEGKYEICGTIVCPTCYYDMLMHPTKEDIMRGRKHFRPIDPMALMSVHQRERYIKEQKALHDS